MREDDNLDECGGSNGLPSCQAKMQQRRAALLAIFFLFSSAIVFLGCLGDN
jgi:hypothetical protein